jgi:hypothetical protein
LAHSGDNPKSRPFQRLSPEFEGQRNPQPVVCHAWDDRQGAAKELHDLLVSRGVSVWFSEKVQLLFGVACEFLDKPRFQDPMGRQSRFKRRRPFRHGIGF